MLRYEIDILKLSLEKDADTILHATTDMTK